MIWKVIPFAPNYEISDNGMVMSHKCVQDKALKPYKDKNGYWGLTLRVNGKSIRKRIHNIVAETFIENMHNYPCVNHIDGNKTNNNVSNLEWCTYKYNSAHCRELGLNPQEIITLNIITGIFYNRIKDAAFSCGMKESTLYSMLNGYRKNKSNFIRA